MKTKTKTVSRALLPLLLGLSLSSCLAAPKVKAKSIAIAKNPNKTQYYEGDLFDPTGIEVNLVYSDGSSAPLDFNDCNYDLKDPLSIENTYVVILYENFMTDVKIHVVEDTPVVVSIATMPSTLVYSVGDVFDPSGLSLDVTKESGRKEVVSYRPEDERFSFDRTPLSGSDRTVTLTYAGLPVSIPISYANPYKELGTYFAHCNEASSEPVLNTQCLLSFGAARYSVQGKDYGEIKGSATDDDYFYVSSSASEKGKDCRLLKINPADGALLGYSGPFTAQNGSDSQLLLKDGVLTVLSDSGALDFNVSDFTTEGDGVPLTSSSLSFLQDGATLDLTTLFDWDYNATTKKYFVLLNTGKILVYSEDRVLEKTIPVTIRGSSGSDDLWNAHLSTTGSYLYLSHHNLWLQPHQNPSLSVYDYDGNVIVKNYSVKQDVLPAQNYTRLTDGLVFKDSYYVFYANPAGSPIYNQPGITRIYTPEKVVE